MLEITIISMFSLKFKIEIWHLRNRFRIAYEQYLTPNGNVCFTNRSTELKLAINSESRLPFSIHFIFIASQWMTLARRTDKEQIFSDHFSTYKKLG